MSRLRRFRVESLENLKLGDSVVIPADEVRHIRVLRLKGGERISLFDDAGRQASATLADDAPQLRAVIVEVGPASVPAGGESTSRLLLASAWPKGKRAALLVEKCTELGVNRIIPVRYSRSVVSKDKDSEGIARLRRIAAEAAKQCGRGDVPEIAAERGLRDLLETEVQTGQALALVFHPGAELQVIEILRQSTEELIDRALLLIIGPEGGLTDEELKLTESFGAKRARLANHILRVETAAIAACAIAGAMK